MAGYCYTYKYVSTLDSQLLLLHWIANDCYILQM